MIPNEKQFWDVKKFIISSTNKKDIDAILSREVKNTDRQLKVLTPKDTGDTRRAWVTKKLGELLYSISNNKVTQDRKHTIIDILNDGHREILPIKAKRLFIPISNRAKAKKLGAKIPEEWEMGVDYVFKTRVGPVKGLKFLEDIVPASERSLLRKLMKFFEDGK